MQQFEKYVLQALRVKDFVRHIVNYTKNTATLTLSGSGYLDRHFVLCSRPMFSY